MRIPRNVKQYELTNHLGNVLSTVLDRKTPITATGGSGSSTTITHYEGDVVFATDYYPFGSPMSWSTPDSSSGRMYSGGGYRFGFNGQEKDNEIAGVGNSYTAEFWEMDPRVGRRWNRDPRPNSSISTYAILQDNPLWYTDHKGDTIKVTTSNGKYLFKLDDGKTKLKTMTAIQVYNQGSQWFEVEADNYMPLIDQADDLLTNSSLKHFTWNQISTFSEEDRWMSSYFQGGSGDWKALEEGGDEYFLITVDGKPYWADAIGQIPFAVDYFTDVYEDNGDKELSIKLTLQKGKEYGDGKLFGKTDNSNNYDNYFLLRGAKWASKRYDTDAGSGWFGDDYDLKKTKFSPSNLGKSISGSDAKKYRLK